MQTDDAIAFNADLMSMYAKHWLLGDTETKVGIMYALCLALATSIAFLSEGDEKKADAASMMAEEHIRDAVEDFMRKTKKKDVN